MCYASQQVIRKEFDYNAYIAGRLRGEYVVIYNTITEEADTVLPEDTTGKGIIYVQQNKDISDLPDYLFLRPISKITVCRTGSKLTSFDTYLVHCCFIIKPLNTFAFASSANCRGAPQCFS
jgi:hypothetical protein